MVLEAAGNRARTGPKLAAGTWICLKAPVNGMLAFALEEGAALWNGTTPLDDRLELLPRDAILCHQSFGDAFQRLRMLPHKRFGFG